MSSGPFMHWKTRTDRDGILWCTLDVADAGVNTLSSEVLKELSELVRGVESDPPTGMIIESGKPSGFCAGADVRDFTAVEGSAQAREFIREVHDLFDRIDHLQRPTLALIRGFCLGGGLELALACRYRVALDDPDTRLGFPEVMIGIFPGFGGTMRAIRRIGALGALPLMLAGRNVDARRAQRLGLVDHALPARQLERAAAALIRRDPGAPRRRLSHRIVSFTPLRRLIVKFMGREVRKRANPAHYPAPFALLDHWRDNGGSDRAMLDGEADGVARLVTTDTSRNLVRAFLLQERMKALGKAADFSAQRVHVVGAGVMGGDIAAWCALRGMQVTLQDREPRFIAPAIGRAHKLFKRRLKVPRRVQAAMDRLLPDPRGLGVQGADVVIEAIIEDLDAKAALFREIEPNLGEGAILASNTSSIALETLGKALQRPERLVGIHFFNPVAQMQLVEIVHGAGTAREWVDRAAAFCRDIGKLPLPVKSSPGFLVNRILSPYLLEMGVLLHEGMQAELVDRAATDFGMPMGPVELADTVGLDVCLSVAENLKDILNVEIPARFRTMVDTGRLGRKTGQGFYEYKKGKPRRQPIEGGARYLRDVEERLILRILNECAACLREGIVEDAELLDAGMIFGTGFAPFRGGPMRYARARGYPAIVADLERLRADHGDRYAPDPYWQTLINS